MVKIVKLITGEEIIADVTETLDGHVVLKDPVRIGMVDHDQMGFIPYPAYAELKDGLKLKMEFIMFMVALNSKLENEYQATFGKVIVPKSGLTLVT